MKKLSLIALTILFSMFFLVSCAEDEEEEAVDTISGDTQADTGADTGTDTGADTGSDTGDTAADTGADTASDTTDTGIPSDPDEPTDTGTPSDPDEPTDTADPTNPEEPTEPTDPTNQTEPTNPEDPTDPTNPGEGGDNLNTGDTSGNQAQSGKPGAACSDDDDCKGNFGSGDSEQIPVCLTSNDIAFPSPSGYCSYFCDITDSGACDSAGELCYLYSNFNGVCLHKCTKPSDCRVGYRCSNTIHACLPDCANSECKTGVCDPTDKVCLKEKEN